jgi:hypothetical protein
MRKLIFTFLLLSCSFLLKAQTTVFSEDFENPPLNTTTYGSHAWDINSRIQTNGTNSDTSYIDAPGDVSYLETAPFDCSFNFFVTLSFKSICKVEFFDGGTIEISTDGGNTWTWLRDDGTVSNCVYMGTGLFSSQNSRFQEASYGNWQPGIAAIPDNSWWQTEVFDISSLAGNNADVRLRFKLADNNNNGGSGRNGWAVDQLEVVASFCELIPPAVYPLPPSYVGAGTVYNLGPFTINAAATDPSGIGSSNIIYTVNSGAPQTIPMAFVADSTYTGQIPAVSVGDTICYYIEITDGSFCANVSYWPGPTATDLVCFDVQAGISLPYCDNFDITTNLWTAQGTGSVWELGTPNFGATNSAYTNPNAWDVNLNSAYTNSAFTTLLSPELSNIPVGSTLSFRQNRNCEAFWDGTRLEWAVDPVAGPWTMVGTIQPATPNPACPDCINWYTQTINSSGLPAWDGTSGGWIESSITIDATSGAGLPSVFYRFVFTSDASVITDGFSIDNFCLSPPLPDDVAAMIINQPGSTGPAGNCVPVIVTIKNTGLNTQSNFDVTYVANPGGVTNTVTFPGPLAPGATAQVTLPCFTIPAGQFTICAYTGLTTDSNHFNDTTCSNGTGIPVLALTSCDDFENGNGGWIDSTNNATAAIWELGAPNFGQTTGAHSGTNAWDINLNTGYNFGADAFLSTPIYDLATPPAVNPYLSFWRNQNTAANDGLRLQYEVNGSGVWNTLGVVGDPDAMNWYTSNSLNFSGLPGWDNSTGGWVESRYYLQNIINSTVPPAAYIRFRFEFISGFNGTPNDGVSIDDFCVKQPGPNDVGVTSVISPFNNSAANSTSTVQVNVRNFGSATQSNIPVEYRINNNITGSGVLAGPLAAGASGVVTMTSFTVPSGQYDFCAYTQLAGDSDNSNDTTCTTPVGVPVIVVDYTNPYIDNFDGTNVGWSTTASGVPTTIWQLGPPAFGATSSAYSAPNAWDINLNSAYGNGANCELLSPIFDIQGVAAEISFFRNHNCETGWDGVKMEYYIMPSGPWTLLGTATSTAPCWTNWYNNANLNWNNQPGWAGATGGWVQSAAECLPQFDNQQVQFRFTFGSDASVTQDGFSIDDFNLIIPVPLTAAPLAINTNTINNSFIFPGQSVQFTSPISNPGTTPLTSVNATITITEVGNPVPVLTVTDPIAYSPALPTQQNLAHTFSQLWTASPGVYDVCVITSDPNNGIDQNPFDDTVCVTISVFDSVTVTSSNPYCTDFESGPQWVSVNAISYQNSVGNDWEIGTPNQTIINNALSGTNAWTIDLDANYNNRDSSGLFTPVFGVDNTKFYEISFWHKYDTEPFADGGTVEFSNDNAVTWQQLGFASASPLWFNTPFITALGGTPGLPGWSGTESNWVEAKKQLCFSTTGTAIFRFRFATDNTVNNYEGWAIDDFCFKEIPGPCVVGVSEQTANGLGLSQNYPNPFNGTTTVDYMLPAAGQVKITITNLLGQEIATPVDSKKESGIHSFSVNSKELGAGIYYYTLEFENQKLTRKMIITE